MFFKARYTPPTKTETHTGPLQRDGLQPATEHTVYGVGLRAYTHTSPEDSCATFNPKPMVLDFLLWHRVPQIDLTIVLESNYAPILTCCPHKA